MRTWASVVFGLVLFLLLTAPASAIVFYDYTLNESCGWSADGLNPPPLTCAVGQDWGPRGWANAMVYTFTPTFPNGFTAGDVFLRDATGAVSDLIRFNIHEGIASIAFYSSAGGPDLADIGIPVAEGEGGYDTHVSIVEGSEFTRYAPSTGQAGYGNNIAHYDFYSQEDAVPEPGTLPLLAAGLGLIVAATRRRY